MASSQNPDEYETIMKLFSELKSIGMKKKAIDFVLAKVYRISKRTIQRWRKNLG